MSKIQKAVDSINNMSPDTAYPNGKHIEDLTKQIMKAKDANPQTKMQLLVALYTNYYSMQHERAVRFDVLETSYESFTEVKYDSEGTPYIQEDPIKYQKFFEPREAEIRYGVNRKFRDSAILLLEQINYEQGDVDNYLKSIDEISFAIIKRSIRLKDDYWENILENRVGKYVPGKDEDELNNLFQYKLDKLTYQAKLSTSPFPEYETAPKPPIDFESEAQKYGRPQTRQENTVIEYAEDDNQSSSQNK